MRKRVLLYIHVLFLIHQSIRAQQKIIVSQDGKGDFVTIQSALNTIPLNTIDRKIIYVKNGIYKEKVILESGKSNVTIVGEDQFHTILTYGDHTGKISFSGDTIRTNTSWTFKVKADHFVAKNITFRNDAGPYAGQAVAVESDGDQAIFSNCRFIGNQDVLYTNNPQSRQFFEYCYIEGTTDFIFGSSTAWFQQCHIHSKKNSHVTAASTPQYNEFGFVFNNCILTGDTSLHKVSLGRPWRPYAHVVYMNCFLGAHIMPEGWSNWNQTDNYKTTKYAEYNNFGISSTMVLRVSWAKQLSTQEAAKYSIANVLAGWIPKID